MKEGKLEEAVAFFNEAINNNPAAEFWRQAEGSCAPHSRGPGRQNALGHRHRRTPMILFLDTSALVKLYVEEPNSADVRAWIRKAEELRATGWPTWRPDPRLRPNIVWAVSRSRTSLRVGKPLSVTGPR